MAFATAHTVSLQGAVGHLIEVQADVSPGIVATIVVGRPDVSLNEARDRCRMAIANSDLGWPSTKRVTILLSPADLSKSGSHFDLAMAVAVLGASGKVPKAALAGCLFVGELTLAGGLRSVPGVLPMVLAAARRGITEVYVPEPQAAEACMVPGVSVYGMRSLAQVVAQLAGEEVPEAPPVAEQSGSRLLTWRGDDRLEDTDMIDVLGLADARYALEVAAAGGHHLMLTGPKGAGKTTLAERLPGVLPDLDAEESLELTAIHSLAGVLDPAGGMLRRPPFAAPHHDASKASLIGGGTGRVRPGEISRAHHGVLFLDEFPLFRTDVIEALRQPLESGDVTIARGEESATFPARGIVVVACNPCPCGEYSAAARDNRCTCAERARRDYRSRITGPLSDRIDIVREVAPLQAGAAGSGPPESSAAIRERVTAARHRQAERYAGCGWRLNGHVPGPALRDSWPLSGAAQRLLDDKIGKGLLTRRGAVRVHRLAWTVADLSGSPGPGEVELVTALRLRTAEPLMLADLGRRAG
ncbi:YifB family Mg chelatase-like AAA ATPase [Nocardioides sp. SOB77]|uniref:YifB family Mg chelatase-like AAA ATPase n=1 Tax=Nocardioides oceani TaxID=3058369 RepID=A0ABT8FFA9_9ACTN|nr:YifB family Mg chelatase-like AAA ATPase [Nocardioides oceani]MDN4172857.1 YifB family Mg chelatase-like AAA ATPase [Nocardioides oceani]